MSKSETIKFYDVNAQEYFESTVNINLDELYESFLKHIPPKGNILDLGCGSGRDSLHFLNKGYNVISIDASEEMVKLSSELTKRKTIFMNIEEIDFHNEFDGIWACASLLHINKNLSESVFNILCNALKNKGILYASYKYGNGARILKKRYFNNYNETSIKKTIHNVKELNIIDHWVTNDLRPSKKNEKWLNIILSKNQTH
jgi:SAM-dependent methyltransferase